MAERERRRVELRADPATREARRRTLMWAGAQLVAAAALMRGGFAFRHMIRPGYYVTSLPGVFLILSAMIVLGVGLVLLVKSPLRMPLGERLFRVVWLGPTGRAFVRLGARRVWRGSARVPEARSRPGAIAGAARNSDVARGASGPVAPDRIAALESRVTELERWRGESMAH